MPRPRKTTTEKPSIGTPHVPPVLDWEVSETYVHNGRQIEHGTELKVRGESGRFLFLKHVRRPNGIEWIDAIHTDTKGASTGYRSFRPAEIQTVHRLTKTRANATVEQ